MDKQKETPKRRDTNASQPGASGKSLGWQDGFIPGLGSGHNMPRPSPTTPAPTRRGPPTGLSFSAPNLDYDSGASEHEEFTHHLRHNKAQAPGPRALPAPPINPFPRTSTLSSTTQAGTSTSGAPISLESLQVAMEDVNRRMKAELEDQRRKVALQQEEIRALREAQAADGNRIAKVETDQQKFEEQFDAAWQSVRRAFPALPPMALNQQQPLAQLPPAHTPLAITQGTPTPHQQQTAYGAHFPVPHAALTTPNPHDDVFRHQPAVQQHQQHIYQPPMMQQAQQQLIRAPPQRPWIAQAPPQAREYHPTPARPQSEAPLHPPEEGISRSIKDIHIGICGKIENFVVRFCLLPIPERTRDPRMYHLFQMCVAHVETAWRARYFIREPAQRKYLYTGVLQKMLHTEIIGTNILKGFRCDQTDKYAQIRYDEERATGLLTGANDYKLRDDIAKRRSIIANIIVCETKGFHGWLARSAQEHAQNLIESIGFLVPPNLYEAAVKEMAHVVSELYRFAARLACEPYYYTTLFYSMNTTFDHKVMIHRNPEYNGRRIDEEPSQHVVMCVVAPEMVQKDFSDHTKMQKKYLHKAEVIIIERKDAHMRS